MKWTGTVFGVMVIPQGKGELMVSARSTSVNGIYAYMSVSLDGKNLGGCYVRKSHFKEYRFPLNREKTGATLVEIKFENDQTNSGKGEDRNLFVESISVF